jgi:hypothetical protein
MMNAKQLAQTIEVEQKVLYSKIQTEFWQALFRDILQEHTFQADFFLVRQDVDFTEVVLYLQNLIKDECRKFKLELGESNRMNRTELKVRFHNYGILKTMYDELSIVICKEDITMRMLPHSPLIKMYSLDDYQLVGKVFQSLCEKVFGDKLEDYVTYLENLRRVEKSGKKLTFKTIEIAKNSIKTIYQATDEKFKSIKQWNIYSSMVYKGKTVSVLHNDFLENPGVLISQLK